jgi:hypothetical protein
VARQRLRKRVFRAWREGWKQGFKGVQGSAVIGKSVDRPVVAAMEWEESEFIDGGLRSGRIETEQWGMEDGKR